MSAVEIKHITIQIIRSHKRHESYVQPFIFSYTWVYKTIERSFVPHARVRFPCVLAAFAWEQPWEAGVKYSFHAPLKDGDPCQGKAILLWLWFVSRPLESMSRGSMSCNGFPFARLSLCSCRAHYKLIDIILGTFTGHLQWHVVHGNGLRSYESTLVEFLDFV